MELSQFPRDVELSIIKNFDMDTRIKTGIIGKLTVPDTIAMCLERIIFQKNDNIKCREKDKLSGHIVTFPLSRYKYYECYYDDSDHNMYWYFVELVDNAFPKLSCLFCG